MANEFHNGLLRCVRTREIGRRLLPVAHECGVRHLAMEALYPEFVEAPNRERRRPCSAGYLEQRSCGPSSKTRSSSAGRSLPTRRRIHAVRSFVPLGGTAGMLVEDVPASLYCSPAVDALVFSLNNELV
jgi:hypothetical protein